MNRQLPILLLALFVSLLGIVFRDPLWGALGVSDALVKVQVATFTSMLLLLSGFLITVLRLLDSGAARTVEATRDLIRTELGQSGRFESPVFHNGFYGLNLVAEKLPSVIKVLNTRIIPSDYTGNLYGGEATAWNNNISEAVMAGVDFRDVVCGPGIAAARCIEERLSGKTRVKGQYAAFQVEAKLASFLNFKVLTMRDQSKEVWVGWRVSNGTNLNEPCFRSTDPTMVKLFEDWHQDLVRSGTRIAQISTKQD